MLQLLVLAADRRKCPQLAAVSAAGIRTRKKFRKFRFRFRMLMGRSLVSDPVPVDSLD